MQRYQSYLHFWDLEPEPEEGIIRICRPWIVDAISNSTLSSIEQFLEVSLAFESEVQDLIGIVKIPFEGLIARSIENEMRGINCIEPKLRPCALSDSMAMSLMATSLNRSDRIVEPKLRPWALPVSMAMVRNVIDALYLTSITDSEMKTEEGIRHAPPPILSVITD